MNARKHHRQKPMPINLQNRLLPTQNRYPDIAHLLMCKAEESCPQLSHRRSVVLALIDSIGKRMQGTASQKRKNQRRILGWRSQSAAHSIPLQLCTEPQKTQTSKLSLFFQSSNLVWLFLKTSVASRSPRAPVRAPG